MITAMVLCVSLLIGSAFALTPSYQKVSMPDPYGISLLSLDDDSDSLTFFNSSSITFGGSSYGTKSYTSQSQSLTSTNTKYQLSYLAQTYKEGYYDYIYLKVPSGTYIDVTANVSYPVSEYSDIIVAGGGSFSLETYVTMRGSVYAYPNTVQILVNDLPVGDVYSVSSTGSFTLSDTIVSLSSDVTTVGLRFAWTTADTAKTSSAVAPVGSYYYLYSNFSDSVVITPVIDDSLDYEPFFNRVIAWEQSIFGAINSLGDRLSDSLGGVGESASKIASVFARDDDIQLRDDVDDTLKEVTTQFYDQTSTSSSSMTVETVQNVKGIADGMDAMFSSGYSVSDAFTEIADNDDFMSWFTAETAQALDSTGNVATVGDDDPYNMHYYYDQVNAIAERRGD